jgi:hypothetical protein
MSFRGFVLLVTFFSFGMSPIGVASAWTGPTQSPPNGNVAAPLNVSNIDQQKPGWIGLDSLSIFKDMIISGSHGGLEPNIRYLNFGTGGWGDAGYGIRDNNGLLQFRNLGGSWQSIQAFVTAFCAGGACGGASYWTAGSGNSIYNNNSGNVGIGTSNPLIRLKKFNCSPGGSILPTLLMKQMVISLVWEIRLATCGATMPGGAQNAGNISDALVISNNWTLDNSGADVIPSVANPAGRSRGEGSRG